MGRMRDTGRAWRQDGWSWGHRGDREDRQRARDCPRGGETRGTGSQGRTHDALAVACLLRAATAGGPDACCCFSSHNAPIGWPWHLPAGSAKYIISIGTNTCAESDSMQTGLCTGKPVATHLVERCREQSAGPSMAFSEFRKRCQEQPPVAILGVRVFPEINVQTGVNRTVRDYAAPGPPKPAAQMLGGDG